jgi:hypothetical protein
LKTVENAKSFHHFISIILYFVVFGIITLNCDFAPNSYSKRGIIDLIKKQKIISKRQL